MCIAQTAFFLVAPVVIVIRVYSVVVTQNAKQLSWDVMIRKYAPVAAVSIVVLFFLYYRFAL